jgi:acylaminoacyl-peptidase
MSNSCVVQAVKHFNELLELPTITRATFLSQNLLQLDSSHRSLSGLVKRQSTQSIILSSTAASTPTSSPSVVATTPLVITSPEIAHTCYSPDGRRSAVFINVPAKLGKDKRSKIEIWDVARGNKENEIDVSSHHREVYADGSFELLCRVLRHINMIERCT